MVTIGGNNDQEKWAPHFYCFGSSIKSEVNLDRNLMLLIKSHVNGGQDHV